MNQQLHRQLVSGSRSGPVASVARFGLRLLSWPYAAAVTLRNICYDRGWFKSDHVAPVVISIGNITAGGTGKTPLVLWLSKMLAEKGLAFVILTRGYKSGKYRLSDEPAILAGAAGRAKVIVNPDRVAAAKEAIEKFNAEVVLMDDGFQHRRLRRDLDIVAIDATCPFGYGRLLPGGLLREPATALKRAQAAVITRCDQVDSDQVEQIKKKLLPRRFTSRFAPSRRPGSTLSWGSLKRGRCSPFAG